MKTRTCRFGSLPDIVFTSDTGQEFYPQSFPYRTIRPSYEDSDADLESVEVESSIEISSSDGEDKTVLRTHLCHLLVCFLIFLLVISITGIYIYLEEQKNPCLSTPCQMNQTCVRNGGGDGPYSCECPRGFYGQHCEKTFTVVANEAQGTVKNNADY